MGSVSQLSSLNAQLPPPLSAFPSDDIRFQKNAVFLDRSGAQLTRCRALIGTSAEWRCSLLAPPAFAFGSTATEAVTGLRNQLPARRRAA